MGLFDFLRGGSPKQEPPTPEPDLNSLFLDRLLTRLRSQELQVDRSTQYAALLVNDCLEICSAVLSGDFHPSMTPFLLMTIHPEYFPNGIEENIVGVGRTTEERVDFAIDVYAEFVLPAILESFDDGHVDGLDFEVGGNGESVLWHPKPGKDMLQGDWNESECFKSLYSLVAHEISASLVDQKLNWLKLYIARQSDGEIACDCLLNNSPWDDGIPLLMKYAETWPKINSFRSQKQLTMFRKCDACD